MKMQIDRVDRASLKFLEKAFGEIYRLESEAIYRFCLLRTSDRNVAQDFTQDTFMRFWNSLLSEKKINNSRAFLFTVARNIVIDWYRKKKTFSLDQMMESETSMRGASFQPIARENVETTVEAAHLVQRIHELPEPYSKAVYLRCVEELKPREISEILGESANVISVRISRGLEQLRKVLRVENFPRRIKA